MRQLRSDESNHEDEINARHFPKPCSWVELAENMAREKVPGPSKTMWRGELVVIVSVYRILVLLTSAQHWYPIGDCTYRKRG